MRTTKISPPTQRMHCEDDVGHAPIAKIHKAQAQLEALLLAGLNSPATEMTATNWADIRREALERIDAV